MKKLVIFLVISFLPMLVTAQATVKSAEKYIPGLQYDNDFMTYIDIAMKDGFSTIKEIVAKMKFVEGDKVYAIEKMRFNPKKQIIEKVTFFYHKTTPIAISIEKGGTVNIYYLDSGNVIASKTFTATDYRPFGGKKTLRLSTIPADEKTHSPKKKYLDQANSLLNVLKNASKSMFNYNF